MGRPRDGISAVDCWSNQVGGLFISDPTAAKCFLPSGCVETDPAVLVQQIDFVNLLDAGMREPHPVRCDVSVIEPEFQEFLTEPIGLPLELLGRTG